MAIGKTLSGVTTEDPVQKKPKLAIKATNFICLILFSGLTVLWLLLKLQVSEQINPNLKLPEYLDIIRLQLGLDISIVCMLALSLIFSSKWKHTFANIVLFVLFTFFFLKLNGLYAFTYDSTPWGMIEYGSFMLFLPFAGEKLSIIFYLLLPISLSAYIFLFSYRAAFAFDIQGFKQSRKALNLKLIFSGLSIVFISGIASSTVPPVQQKIPESIAHHPYRYSLSGLFSEKDYLKTRHDDITLEQIAEPDDKSKSHANIVFIILESFSKRALTDEITPFLYKLREQSLYFPQARADIPHTSKALVSIFCGQSPYFSPYLFESVYGLPRDCIAENEEYDSVFFQPVTESFENRRQLVSQLGFDDFYPLEALNKQGFEKVNYFSYQDEIVLAKSKEWLKTQIQESPHKPFIAAYLTGTSHHNYEVPSSHKPQPFSKNKKYNRYLNALNYLDAFVEKLLLQYQELGLYKKTLFVIVGDHGEGFDTSKPLMHNNNIFESGIHVPLLIHDGNQGKASKNTQLVNQSNIKAIIQSSLANKDYKKSENQSYSACWYMDYCYAINRVIDGTHFKFILDLRNSSEYLYNLDIDPQENHDISALNPEVSKDMKSKLIKIIKMNKRKHSKHFNEQSAHFERNKKDTFSKFKAVD